MATRLVQTSPPSFCVYARDESGNKSRNMLAREASENNGPRKLAYGAKRTRSEPPVREQEERQASVLNFRGDSQKKTQKKNRMSTCPGLAPKEILSIGNNSSEFLLSKRRFASGAKGIDSNEDWQVADPKVTTAMKVCQPGGQR